MKIAIDATCLGRRKTGNETYIRGLLSGLAESGIQESGVSIQVVTTDACEGGMSGEFQWIGVPKGNFFSRNLRTIPWQLQRLKPDLFHASYWTRFWDEPVPSVVMIHDLSFVSFPQGFHRHEQLFYAAVVRKVAERCRHIVTVSEFSKQEIMDHWKIPADKITVTYNGIDACFRPETSVVAGCGLRVADSQLATGNLQQTTHGEAIPYILYVGNLHPRKNLVKLLESFVLLRKEGGSGLRLKIVGQNTWMSQPVFMAVREHGLEKEVEFTGYVSRDELIGLYQRAELTVYPSLYEGFGLPPLEAMACGCPVVCSNRASLPEVTDGAALLVDSQDVEAMAGAITRLAGCDPQQRATWIEKGIRQAGKFTWEACARSTLGAWRAALVR